MNKKRIKFDKFKIVPWAFNDLILTLTLYVS